MAKNDRFEPSSTALVAVRIFNDKNQKVRKVLKNEWYLLNNWYVLKNNVLVKNDDGLMTHHHLYGRNVTVQAIVGKLISVYSFLRYEY